MTLRPGEVYFAYTEAGKRPVVIVSREPLNRGHWVVSILITSSQFATRSALPHCVPIRAGEFGLTKDCIAQAETITYLAIADVDLGSGPVGRLDDTRMRDLIRAIGNMMEADCSPE